MRQIVLEQFNATTAPAARERAEKFLSSEIISSATFPDVHVGDGDVWADRDARSHERYLHGFIFLNDWFGTVLADGEQVTDACHAALRLVESWTFANSGSSSHARMAYHDETTAQRLINLLQLDSFVEKNDPTASASFLRPVMDQTATLLTDPAFHSAGNNHGMFQDLALLYYSILAEWVPAEIREDHILLALGRLRDYFSSCFTSEGVHVENTPTYHVMVSRHLSVVQQIVQAAEHKDAEYYTILLAKAEIYATHALMPNGLYPPISDTTQRRVDSKGVLDVFSSPEFLYAATTGKKGDSPSERVLVLPESGYAIYRSAWGNPNATYLFFSAAYNANYHKHSDDLSLYLRSGNLDLLAESGPFSYDYKNPFSRYAYSQFSHNSLIVDGTSLPRTDHKSSFVKLKTIDHTPEGVIVEGTNGRYEDTTHVRRVEVDEASGHPEINLIDKVKSGGEHRYQLLWNLGTKLTVVLHGQGFEIFHGQEKIMDLTFTANVPTRLSLHRGRTKPRPLGWTFPNFGEAQPSNVVQIDFQGKCAELQTSIRLKDFSYRDRGIHPQAGWKRYQGTVPLNYLYSPPRNGDAKKLVVVFSAIHSVGDFTYNYKSTVDRTQVGALYILDDFGDQGSYYFSDHRSTNIFESVQSLIKKVMSDYDFELSDVATAGSSKGGAAALIHGLALGASRIIVGAPQTRIGSFLRDPHPNMLRFMTGGIAEEDIAYLDSIIPCFLRDAVLETKISIVVGEADHHLAGHINPLLTAPRPTEVEIRTLVLPGIRHSDIGKVYSLYLQAALDQWANEIDEDALPYALVEQRNQKGLTIAVYSPSGSEHAYRLYEGSRIVKSIGYSDRREMTFTELAPGTYRVRVFTRMQDPALQTSFTTRRLKVHASDSLQAVSQPEEVRSS